MARLKEVPPHLGTFDGVCVYTRWGNYYIRTKSTLSGKRVKTAPEFKRTWKLLLFWPGLQKLLQACIAKCL